MGEPSIAIVTGGSAGMSAAMSEWTSPTSATTEAAAGVAKKFADGVVMFLATPENSFISGQVLYVCGGTRVASISF